MALWSRREWLSKAGMGVAALSLAPALIAEEPHVPNHSRNNISDEDEIALGEKFGAALEKEQPIATNPVIDPYLNSLVRQLAAKSQRPNMPYKIKLINTMDVNACSIPGGTLYINRGLLELVTSEDQLAATLAHEIGHVVGRHAINQMMLTFQARALLKPVLDNLNKNNGVIQQIILKLGGAVAILAMLHFSREDEAQADLLGFYEVLRAGWDPHGFVKMFAMLEKVEKASGGASIPFLSDHPPTPERLAAMKREITRVTIPSDARTDSMSFHACKGAIHFLPEPPKPHKRQAEEKPQ
jgi:predicted Zn-dependent protease